MPTSGRNASSTTFASLLNKHTLDGLAIDGSHLKFKSNKFFESFCPSKSGLEKLNISKIIYPYIHERAEIISSHVRKLTGCSVKYKIPEGFSVISGLGEFEDADVEEFDDTLY